MAYPLVQRSEAIVDKIARLSNDKCQSKACFGGAIACPYRRLAVMLKRDGLRLNLNKVYRLYKEERLNVRKRGGRKRALGTRASENSSLG